MGWNVRRVLSWELQASALLVALFSVGMLRHKVDLDYTLPELVDLSRYPIDELRGAAGRALVARAREDLRTSGCASFPGFLGAAALADAVEEAARKAPAAFATDATHNAYQLSTSDLSLPEAHVRNLRMRTRVASTAYDELAADGALRRLYANDVFLDLVGAVTGARVFRLDDALGAASINVFEPAWEHAWHYDESEYTVTLSLQTADEGGAFEFTKPLRNSSDDLAAAATAAVVSTHSTYDAAPRGGASTPAVSAAPFAPGTLQIFAGRYSLHRVAPVVGASQRLVAVFCFADAPGFVNTPDVQQMFWGRTA